ncbi:collagen-like protein [Pseudomonas cichorii]|uniref:Collagen-like protein n=1 Tax=Pseudomonas lijiangensis TaxID=2995658 RepID=A0ABX8HNR7_9PSED|nr:MULTISPECIES: collagen-like protein [Pseudomonas syringae group]MBX8491606.1 collagen-like protein [Pseudomonas cichorii]MBX8500631.1 collagen-like protein [Pseudomonas lijiangensis]MBX8504433.1 collagen-like protein [Pseudomonas lijiangensis]MBX8519571.1 collagen-like protein [Pseudomonas cichorii]MBX8538263.1 collagen-like protein [Pseudomonas cichorii]
MRNLLLLTALFSPLALAQTISVESHSLMRLPGNNNVLQVERLEVADYGTLLIPSNITEVKVGELVLGHEARIAIVPGSQTFSLVVNHGELGAGSEIMARGAPGTFEKTALPGRNLILRLQSLNAEQLTVDARGGAGARGYAGLDGGNGQAPGCVWGQASRGYDGDNGGSGRDGAAGAQVRLELPQSFAAERIKVNVEGGAPGPGGEGGKPGKGGESKGCIVYRADGGKPGKPGQTGQPGAAGPAGTLNLQRL